MKPSFDAEQTLWEQYCKEPSPACAVLLGMCLSLAGYAKDFASPEELAEVLEIAETSPSPRYAVYALRSLLETLGCAYAGSGGAKPFSSKFAPEALAANLKYWRQSALAASGALPFGPGYGPYKSLAGGAQNPHYNLYLTPAGAICALAAAAAGKTEQDLAQSFCGLPPFQAQQAEKIRAMAAAKLGGKTFDLFAGVDLQAPGSQDPAQIHAELQLAPYAPSGKPARLPEVFRAAAESNLKRLAELRMAGADPDEPGPDGLRPVHAAANTLNVKALRLLLDNGWANHSLPDSRGRTAAQIAMERLRDLEIDDPAKLTKSAQDACAILGALEEADVLRSGIETADPCLCAPAKKMRKL